ncbi:MAG TPA: GIY-YIG nuclease family protein [Bacteroidales bacterium]|nr:GIY-YIG nuclease family protein [Bacteroidales bacterium]HPJ60812.1 GIY-YIG nuclease family protein [Bacteroidales bacterium]HPR13594.1 GIY-YIG nuclease family protein [Bacteroidales bacterium]HRW86556.1 GIY-YIG nuclease family protein [Bacteroidales bacterium]
MRYTVYILQSQVDNTFYIGYTSNLERRLSEHNEGRTRYSSSKRPWELLYSEEYTTKRDAIMRERFLKKQKNKAFYLSLKG